MGGNNGGGQAGHCEMSALICGMNCIKAHLPHTLHLALLHKAKILASLNRKQDNANSDIA